VQDERDAPRRRDAGGRVLGVQQVERAGDGFFERERDVDAVQEGGDARGGEVADLEAQDRLADRFYVGSLGRRGEVGVCRVVACVVGWLVGCGVSDGELFDRRNDGYR
jgi:hypothetical protein